jgi:hypothetical protein
LTPCKGSPEYLKNEEVHIDELFLYQEEKVRELADKYQDKVKVVKTAFETAFESLAEIRNNNLDEETNVSIHDLRYMDLLDFSEIDWVFERFCWSSSSIWC